MNAFETVMEKLIETAVAQHMSAKEEFWYRGVTPDHEDYSAALLDLGNLSGRIDGLSAALAKYREEGCPRERAHDELAFKIPDSGSKAVGDLLSRRHYFDEEGDE
jgi:hypothetical protein